MVYNLNLCYKFYNRFQMSPCDEGYGNGVVYESKDCCKQNLYTFLLIVRSFLYQSYVGLFIRRHSYNMNYGEEGKLTKSEKLVHSYNGLCEWSSAMEQLHSGQLYNSEHGIHVGEKLRKKPTMQYTQNLVLNLEKF